MYEYNDEIGLADRLAMHIPVPFSGTGVTLGEPSPRQPHTHPELLVRDKPCPRATCRSERGAGGLNPLEDRYGRPVLHIGWHASLPEDAPTPSEAIE